MPLGKASLAESFALPPVQSPSRASFPKSKDLLGFHGFDASFDQRLRRAADAIVAQETPLDNLLGPALERQISRRRVAGLPCARVRLLKALGGEAAAAAAAAPGKDAGGAGGAGAAEADKKVSAAVEAEWAQAASSVAQRLAGVLARWHVEASDLLVSREGGSLCCELRLCPSDASIVAVVEAWRAALQDKKGFPELHEALAEAGAAPEAAASVAPVWPLERVLEELRLAFPEYDFDGAALDERLPAILARSWAACREAWDQFGGEAPSALEPLLLPESVARFDEKLLPVGDGERKGLREDLRLQSASTLDEALADAKVAQRALKEALAEGSTWSKLQLNDVLQVPYDSARRMWIASLSDAAPNAQHYDPGLKDRHLAFEKAKRMQRLYEAGLPIRELLDCSRLSIAFTSVADASEGLRRLQDKLDVVWFENRFRSPSCWGRREAILGVRQQVASEAGKRGHISEILLRVQELHEAQLINERERRAELGKLLGDCGGVKPQHLERCIEIIEQALACTAGSAEREAHRELARIVAHYTSQGQALSAEGLASAERLADEAADQALASGVAEEEVSALLAEVPRLNDKRSLRGRRIALVDDLAQRLLFFRGMDVAVVLDGLLDDFASLPPDELGRVSLPLQRWWDLPQLASSSRALPEVLRSVVPSSSSSPSSAGGGGGQSSERRRAWEGLLVRAQAIAAEERALLGAAEDLGTELGAVAARSSALQLAEDLVRFLLSRSAGGAPSSAELAASAQWAEGARGASRGALQQVGSFLRWTAFEEQICAALEVQPGPRFMGAFREALRSADEAGLSALDEEAAERGRCVARWQTTGAPNLCRRLEARDQRALPLTMALLELGVAEVRSRLAEAMTGSDGGAAEEEAWAPSLIGAGALPLLAGMLATGPRSEGKIVFSAAFALRYIAAHPAGCEAVSKAELLPRLATLALDSRLAGDDASYLALGVLNHLAKNGEEEVAQIRELGLQVDSVGRVKKKR